ncbi:hypothetical protein Tco_0604235 [Tanacetum coccineum]
MGLGLMLYGRDAIDHSVVNMHAPSHGTQNLRIGEDEEQSYSFPNDEPWRTEMMEKGGLSIEGAFGEIEAYLKDDSISPEIDHADCDPKGDICLIEKLLNNDPFQLPPMDLKQSEVPEQNPLIEEPPN